MQKRICLYKKRFRLFFSPKGVQMLRKLVFFAIFDFPTLFSLFCYLSAAIPAGKISGLNRRRGRSCSYSLSLAPCRHFSLCKARGGGEKVAAAPSAAVAAALSTVMEAAAAVAAVSSGGRWHCGRQTWNGPTCRNKKRAGEREREREKERRSSGWVLILSLFPFGRQR
jgi:hypothetical protein